MKKIKYILFSVAALSFFSCSHFDELNTNPTKSTNMDPQTMIPAIQMRQSENHQEWARYLAFPGGFMNHWTGEWAMTEYGGRGKRYGSYMEQMWISYYPIILRNVVDVVERTRDDAQKTNLHSVARILKAQCFHKITDMYGDVPYFGAGLGYHQNIIMPKYDEQKDIYNDLLKELREASEALDPTGDMILYDLYYGGDIVKWQKFANSLRLRIAMRLVKVDPARAKTEAEAAIAAGVFESNDDICFIRHEMYDYVSEGVGKGNGIAVRLQNAGGDPKTIVYFITTELIDVMESGSSVEDPRIKYFCGSYLTDPARTDITDVVKNHAAFGTYSSMSLAAQKFVWDDWLATQTFEVNGQEITLEHSYWRLQPSKYITATDSPFIHMSYAEVAFLVAEAAQRGWDVGGGTAQDYYTAGLEAAIRQWSLFGVKEFDEPAIAAYLAAQQLTPGDELLDINTQLWVLHILDPIEAWSNWRRTGMPDIVFKNLDPAGNQSNGMIPRRLEYPLEEQLKNPTSYREAVNRQPGGKDDWLNRMWWDKE